MFLSGIEIGTGKLWPVVQKQYIYKLKSSSTLIYSFILIQALGLLFSLSSNGGGSAGSDLLMVSVSTYSANILQVLTLMWMFAITMQFNAKNYRNMEFSLVRDSLSSHLSNILLVLSIALFAGVSSTLMTGLHRIVLLAINTGAETYFVDGLSLYLPELLLGSLASTLYMILAAALGYFYRALIELSRVFFIILPVLYLNVGLLANGQNNYASFFGSETSLSLFAIKVILTAFLFFALSILINQRLEVGK
jgi:hypothetical protein